jgi:nitrous oxidase accessory protein NosD
LPVSADSVPAPLSVRDFGARGDGHTLDTAAIQAAVDAVPPGGVLSFPPGTYRIASDRGIALKDDVHLELGRAVIVAANVDDARCRLIEVQGRRNVRVSGGTLVGSREGSPEWGVGILASDASELLIENVTLRNFYFDGILLTGNRGCRRVVVRGVVAENNRRTGLAAPAAEEVLVEDSSFRGTRGQSPEAGANFEPNPGGVVRGVHVRRSTFAGNAGVGLYVHRGRGDAVAEATLEQSVVEDNGHGVVMSGVEGITIADNRVSGHRREATSGIVVADTGRAVVRDNRLLGNFRGILSGRASGVEIVGNTVEGLGWAGAPEASGIVCLGPSPKPDAACRVVGNSVSRCPGSGVVAQLVSKVQVIDNTIADVGQRGLLLRAASRGEVRGNSVAGSGLAEAGAYAAIELVQSSSDNVIASNTIRLGAGASRAISICPGCVRNEVSGNVVLP